MNNRIQGKNIVITGASGGIGERMALKCAEAGANVVLLARNLDKLLTLKENIEINDYGRAWAYQLDVSQYDAIPPLFSIIKKEIGPIDILINNAGYGIFDEAHEASFEDIKGMFDVNVLGLIRCTQQVIPDLQMKKSGHIVNIASQAGKLATPKSSAYSASKHAVLGYTNSLRMELSRSGVFVTAVNPGPIATDFFTVADSTGSYVKNVEKYMLDPDYVAEKVVSSLMINTREINLPGWMNIGSVAYQLFPKLVERLGKNAFFKK
ncbi:SDR family NAD(P)-dependent oxidoreductase [Rossellomorea sp. BNER]|uniref:SDR family NAD(P)-dependent oxidoreductase n=1 Tax=Rossellomorea sp. BNER TaxID=2962031 RepID=UPI003AF24AA1|nr:SDR family oxidoreductase [Rossellomorea sp. BNER]